MRIAIILSLGATLLTGCMVGPAFEEPEVEAPAQYRFDPGQLDSLGNLAWWELFQDTLLHRLIDSALANNYNVRVAAARIEEARAFAGFSEADLYPQIDISANVLRGNAQQGPFKLGSEITNIGFAPTLTWDIGFWGRFRRANRAAQQQLLGAQYAQRSIMIDLISEVSSAYFLLVGLDAQLAIARNTAQTREDATALIRARFERGIAAEIDLNQAEIQQAIAEAAIPIFERQVAQTENALGVLLGQPVMNILRDSLDQQVLPPAIPPGLPANLLARRPDIQEFYFNLAAQHEQIGIAEALRLPSISISAMFGVASNDLPSLFTAEGIAWNVAGGLFGPLFNWGQNLRRVEIQEAVYDQVLLNYYQRVLVAFQEVENALVGIQTYRDETDARLFQLRAADNAVRLSRARYYGGETSYLEVLESERQQFSAALEAAAAYTEQLIAYVQLYKALGGGWISEAERAASQ